MRIKNIIVHSIIKQQHQDSSEIQLILREELLPIESRVTGLLEGIRTVYTSKSGKVYGTLGEDRSFSRELSLMLENKTNFLDFTKIAMRDLESRMAAQPLATGGYILFTEFVNKGINYFMVVMLKSKDGLSFDDELELMDVQQLDLDKLHFGARIDIDAWQNEDDGNNVSFIKGRESTPVTQYFKDFIGIEEFSESSVTTDSLVRAVTNFFRQKLELSTEEVKTKKLIAYNYCKEKFDKGELIYLNELSMHLHPSEPEQFLSFAQTTHEVPNEFHVNKTKLNKFVKFAGKDKDITISFSANAWGNRVSYDAKNDILHIHKIPRSLKEQLENELG